MASIASLLSSYGITGNPTIDALILAYLIPSIISYAAILFNYIQTFLYTVIWKRISQVYMILKQKYLGIVDFRLSVSQEKNIYPTIRNIFFSSAVKSDEIDSKTLGILNLVTESKTTNDSEYWNFYDNIYELCMDESNNITIEKYLDFGSAISKKYFEFDNYYIVISENKKTDHSTYFKRYRRHESKDSKSDTNVEANNASLKKPDTNSEHFILFEAIRRSSSVVKDDNIIKKFLYSRFNLKTRIPYKYIIEIDDNIIASKFSQNSDYVSDDANRRELKISDGIEKFLSNEKINKFYGGELNNFANVSDTSAISSSLITHYRGNVFDVENMSKELFLMNMCTDDTNADTKLFSPNFFSILKYFFGNKFVAERITQRAFFYFKDNKIILFFAYKPDVTTNYFKHYICVVSFQEILRKENIVEIFSELIEKKIDTVGVRSDKMVIYNYRQGEWVCTKCKSRSYDTIYLPLITKKLITTEMEKFICFEKVFRENGIPYKKGFLFYGPPGTGKTSLVKALAYTYNIPIYIFDINNDTINDENITEIINSISGTGNRILLFEDIDSAFSNKEELKYQTRSDTDTKSIKLGSNNSNLNSNSNNNLNKKFLTYSGLLNALDGVMSGHDGTIMIMTTNHYEKLGPALVRPGRIDFCLELTYCDRDQLIQMTRNMIVNSYNIINMEIKEINMTNNKISFLNPYSPEELELQIENFANNLTRGHTLSKVKPCELQTYILKHIDSVESIFTSYDELFK